MKVAVYGTLRKRQSNSSILKDSEYLGSFESEPDYNMYSVHDVFPAITEGGYTSVKMEVFKASRDVLKRLDGLEGYRGKNNPDNHYNRSFINTPWGKALVYTYNSDVSRLQKIDSGDWVDYMQQIKIKDYV